MLGVSALAAPIDQPADGGAIRARVWLTWPLWGLADSAPYLHDGRALTIDDAIRAHGGEAQAARASMSRRGARRRARRCARSDVVGAQAHRGGAVRWIAVAVALAACGAA